MIYVERLSEPQILTENKSAWTDAYLASIQAKGYHRPSSKQYGHPKIRETLSLSSFGKCFYCERKLSEKEAEVDHYIETSLHPELAFEWSNLYYSCGRCNRTKPNHQAIPIENTLNPCAIEDDFAQHLTFEKNFIRARNNSSHGFSTIQKYSLFRGDLELQRANELLLFVEKWREIESAMNRESRSTMTPQEYEELLRFRQKDSAFSLMFTVYLTKYNL